MSAAPSHHRKNDLGPEEAPQQWKRTDTSTLDQFIDSRIDESCRALWRAEFIRKFLGLVVRINVLIISWLVLDQWIYSPGPILRCLAFGLLVTVAIEYLLRHLMPILGSTITPEYAARALEKDLPNARQSLLSYLTLRNESKKDKLGFGVLRSLASSTGKQLRGHDALPTEVTGTVKWWLISISSLALLVAYVLISPKSSVQAMMRLGAPLANIDAPQRVLIDQVLPGDAEVTAGQLIEIQASIQGLYANEAVTCVWNSVTKQDQFELIYDKEINHYVGTLAVPYTSARVINYEVIAGDASAGPYTLSVQDAPVVAIDRINYSPPKYTRLGNFSKTVGAIKTIDGTNIEITAQVNRPVKRAKIEFNPALVGERLQATAGVVEMSIDSTGKGLSTKFAVRTDSNLPGTRAKESYRILVWDEVNQENIDPIIYPIDVLADIPPEIAITLPAKTPKDVPFNAQQRVELHASDPDFGLSRIELQINYGNQRELVPVLWENRAGKLGRQLVSIPIRPEEFNLKIGDTIELIGIATDNRRDDQPGTSPAILQPNVTRTDPIRLRVTAPSSLPAEDDPEADGLSNPQSNPSKPSTQSEGEQGADESGAGGSGSGDASQQNGNPKNGDPLSDSSTSDMPNDTEDSSEGSSGNGSNNDTQTGTDNQSSNPTGDANASNDHSNQGTSQGDPSESKTQAGQEDQASEDESTNVSSEQNGGMTSESQPQQADAEPIQSNSDSNQENQLAPTNPNDTSQDSNPRQGRSSDQSDNPTSSSEGDQTASTEADSENSQDQTLPENASQDSNQSDAGSQPKRKPDHDGEAFERIRDFLENKDRNKSAGDPDPGGDSDSSDSSEPKDSRQPSESSTDASDANESSTNENRLGQESQSESASTTEQSQGLSDGTSETADEENSSSSNDSDSKGENPSTKDQQNSSDGQKPSQSNGNDSSNDGSTQQGESNTQKTKDSQSANDSPSGKETPNESETSTTDSNDKKPTSGDSEKKQNGDSGSDSPKDKTGEIGDQTNSERSDTSPTQGDEIFGDGSLANPQPPDEVDLEYAKKATDLVLDYLERTRDQPNQDLLQELQWSEKDLNEFVDRWNKIRELPNTAGSEGNDELDQTLKSLGLRSPSDGASRITESEDSLGSLIDSAPSQPVPAAYRDAFNEFRRAMNQTRN